MQNIRIFFTKRDRAKFISHLDMTRLFQRAVRRSGITMWYTEGFHPHLYMTFALPLSLGIESDCESVDMRLVDEVPFDEVKAKLNSVLPPSIEVVNVSEPKHKANLINSSEYSVKLFNLSDKKAQFRAFLEQDEILLLKKGKAGERLVNVKPFIYGFDISESENDLVCTLKLASGNTNTLNPAQLINLFAQYENVNCEGAFILRTKIFTENGDLFE